MNLNVRGKCQHLQLATRKREVEEIVFDSELPSDSQTPGRNASMGFVKERKNPPGSLFVSKVKRGGREGEIFSASAHFSRRRELQRSNTSNFE